MKAFLVVLLCMHRVHGYEDSIEPKEQKERGVPDGDVIMQRITTAVEYAHQLFWFEDLENLIYTDPLNDEMMVWNYESGEKKTFYIKEISGEYFTMNIPFKKNPNQGLIASDNNFRIITFNSEITTYNISEPVLQIKDCGHIVRTGHCDKNGVLFLVTKKRNNYNEGNFLYKIHNKTLVKVQEFKNNRVDDFVFSYDYKKMFVICDFGRAIGSYDFDIKEGKISNPKILFNATENDISREMYSIELHSEGKLWVSAGPNIMVINQQGNIVKIIETPFKTLTSITFGGYKNKNLLVGSKRKYDEDNLQAGSVLAISGIKGNGQPDLPMVW